MSVNLPGKTAQFPQELLGQIIENTPATFDDNITDLFMTRKDVLDSFLRWSLQHPKFAENNPLLNRIKKISALSQLTLSQPDPSEITEFLVRMKRDALLSGEAIADSLEAFYFQSSYIFSNRTSKEAKIAYLERMRTEFKNLIPKLCDTQKILEVVKIFIKRLPQQSSYDPDMKSQQQFSLIIDLIISSAQPDERAFIYQELLKEKLWKNENKFVKCLLTNMISRNPEYDITGYIKNGALGPKGQQVIVEYLQEKGSLPKDKVAIYEDTDLFEEKLVALSKDPNVDEFYFLFSAPHTTPIYIKKAEGKWIAVVTDSIGEDKFGICQFLKKHLSPEVIYFSPYKRQKDSTACAIFSLRDLVQISRHTEEILSFFREQPGEKDEKTSVKSVHLLPPYLMKTTQSLSGMHAFFAETSFGSQMSSESETFAENLSKHTREGANKFIDDRAAKYWELILTKSLEERATKKDELKKKPTQGQG